MTTYRMMEIAIYALISYLPLTLLALFPFHNRLRFSKGVTVFGMVILYVARIGFTYWTSVADRRGPIVLLGTFVYALFFFLFIKEEIGKCLFPLLMLSNISNLILTATKVTEKLLFPSFYSTPYRLTSSLLFLCMEFIILIPLYFYFKNVFVPVTFENHTAWNYLWLIPLTFYSVWFRNFYFGAEGSKILASRPRYLLFSLVINGGAMLVYNIVVQLIRQHSENLLLTERAHQLSLQHAMYGNIQDRIEEARHAKHDIKQHIHVISSYLSDKKYDELEKYLGRYQKTVTDDSQILYCDNHAINALLQYFAGYAKTIHAGFSASISLPNNVGVPDEALTVVLGNLLENAVEACSSGDILGAAISVHGKVDKGAVFFKVVNTCLKPPKSDKKGDFLSSKREGHGIGLQSVRNIAEQYDGMMKAHWEDGQFIVSVLLNVPLHDVGVKSI